MRIQSGSIENFDKFDSYSKFSIELNPLKEGTFRFHCSMDMAKGKIIVVA
ncbi:MAG: cupredoxin domain-containing protein [Candidatus Aenigmarchaeota archaeon]|nr:cupredoxin domain-containing protein [Candidatus Aenigmarchaeota archaeon]